MHHFETPAPPPTGPTPDYKISGDNPPTPGSGTEQHIKTKFYNERDDLEDWMYHDFADMIIEALQQKSQQLTVSDQNATTSRASRTDAEIANDAAQETAEDQAEVATEMAPRTNLCVATGATVELASSEEGGQRTQAAAAEATTRYHSYGGGGAAPRGEGWEKQERLKSCKDTYCNPDDFRGAVGVALGITAGGNRRVDNDIDVNRTLIEPLTLDIMPGNTSDSSSPAFRDIMEMSKNLYGNEMFYDLTPQRLDRDLFDIRQIQAKRNVLLESFMAQVGLKSKGLNPVSAQTTAVFERLGLPDEVIQRDLKGQPSYYALMDVVTRKLYQDADYYVQLVDDPAANDRIMASGKAFQNMLSRDMAATLQRQEILYSMLLELKTLKAQRRQGAAATTAGQTETPK